MSSTDLQSRFVLLAFLSVLVLPGIFLSTAISAHSLEGKTGDSLPESASRAGPGSTAGSTRQRRQHKSGIDGYSRYLLRVDQQKKHKGNSRRCLSITFLGTTSLLFDDGRTQIMIDGFFSRPSLARTALFKLSTDRKAVDETLARAGVNRLKAVLVSHSHYDHSLDVAYIVKKTGARLLGSVSTLNIGRGGGLPEEQMTLFQPGKKCSFGQFEVTVLPARHSPPRKGINNDLGEVVEKPLSQPARAHAYKEGGCFDFLIESGSRKVLVIPSANFIPEALNGLRADTLFLSIGQLGLQKREFQNEYYLQTIGRVHPQLVVPIHWDNFFKPLSDHLQFLSPGDRVPAALDFLIGRLRKDRIKLEILQGYQSLELYEKESRQPARKQGSAGDGKRSPETPAKRDGNGPLP